jgi:putative transposase
MRKLIFASGEYYHLFNRGVDKRKVFLGRVDYVRFIRTIHNLMTSGSASESLKLNQSLALNKKIKLIGYCLMPNHYHMLVKQLDEDGVTEFMHKLDTSYTKYFNLNTHRTGRLFEYTFKATHIETDEEFIHVIRYIHLNPLVSGIIKDLRKYKWSSYLDLIGERDGKLCDRSEVLGQFSGINTSKSYEKFVLDYADYAIKLDYIKHHLLD